MLRFLELCTALSIMFVNIRRMLIWTVSLALLLTVCLCRNTADGFDFMDRPLRYEDQRDVEVSAFVVVDVNTTEPLNRIEDYFISFTIDCQEFSEHFEKLNFRLYYLVILFVF